MTLTPTPTQLIRLSNDWSKAAGEPIQGRFTAGAFVATCSELGAYRIVYAWYHGLNPNVRMGRNSDGTYYVLLELETTGPALETETNADLTNSPA